MEMMIASLLILAFGIGFVVIGRRKDKNHHQIH